VWDLHCIYRRHISKRFLTDVHYVRTCGGRVILIDLGIKKVAFVLGKITLAGLCSMFSPTGRLCRISTDITNELHGVSPFSVISSGRS
jgi:hypothetical protein